MKPRIAKYIIIGFLLGIFLMVLTGAFNKKQVPGKYTMQTVMDGEVVIILDTQTGLFKTYISENVYNEIGSSYFEYIMAGESDPKYGLVEHYEKLKIARKEREKKYHAYQKWLEETGNEDTLSMMDRVNIQMGNYQLQYPTEFEKYYYED